MTITMSIGEWVAVFVLLFSYGKLLQQGGVLYAEGRPARDWGAMPLAGAACFFGAIALLAYGALF